MTHEDYESYLVEVEARIIERYHAGRIGIEKVQRLLTKIHDWSEVSRLAEKESQHERLAQPTD